MVQREVKRQGLVARFSEKRAELKKITRDSSVAPDERFKAQLKLAKLPRNSAKVRLHHRCELTGRPHAVYRKMRISRIALRELGSAGQIPGLTKSSW